MTCQPRSAFVTNSVLLAIFWLGSVAAAMLAFYLTERVIGMAVFIGVWHYNFGASAAGVVSYVVPFGGVYAVLSVAWVRWGLPGRCQRHPVRECLALLTMLALGLAVCGLVWAYQDMLAGFWPGWDRFLSDCQTAMLAAATNGTLLMTLQEPWIIVTYLIVGWWLHDAAVRYAIPALEGSQHVEFPSGK